VALAANLIDLAIGGDQGGSIRIPSAWCGVVGLKPTHGLVPYTGVLGLEPSIDHVGPMARTVEDVALMLECIAGPDGYDPRQLNVTKPEKYTETMTKGVDGLRIGILREGFGDEEAESDVEESVRKAIRVLEKAGAITQEISVPEHTKCGSLFATISFLGVDFGLRSYGGVLLQGYYDTHLTEVLGRYMKSEARLLPAPIKMSLLLSAHLGYKAVRYYGKAHNIRRLYIRAYDKALTNVDCIIMPTVPIKAPRYAEPKNDEEALHRSVARKSIRVVTRNTIPISITGHPALSVPCALSNGLPVGMMLVGRYFSEALLFRVAYAFEQAVAWDKFLLCDKGEEAKR
jgi:amidase